MATNPEKSSGFAGSQQEPAPKKAKIAPPASATTTTSHQSSLLNFFSSNKKKPAASAQQNETGTVRAAGTQSAKTDAEFNANPSLDPIVPSAPSNITATWQSLHNQHVLLRLPNTKRGIFVGQNLHQSSRRTKIAAFDLDGTLLKWVNEAAGFWPSRLEHYELWNAQVVQKLRNLHDQEQYRLVIFTNQGGIQKAHAGKRATLLHHLTEWIEQHVVQRPVTVVASTRSSSKVPQTSFHKPTPHMWNRVFMEHCVPRQLDIDLESSFFVGDSADDDDSQGGVDRKFAMAVGLKFHTPREYFGPSHQELRQQQESALHEASEASRVPACALQARRALLGGYLQGPIMIVLAGVQGSGKSTFCQQVLQLPRESSGMPTSHDGDSTQAPRWVWLSQDTINNGRPGKREKVEMEAQSALQQGNSVIVDRMHLDPEQRQYFVDVAKMCKVPVHVVLLNPPAAVVKDRVKRRTNHPGRVQGDAGAKLAVSSLNRLVLPTYGERVDLISIVSTEFAANQLAVRYRCVTMKDVAAVPEDFMVASGIPLGLPNNMSVTMPAISLGTMGIGKRKCKETVSAMLSAGFSSIDTAPTYKNEDKVGEALCEYGKRQDMFVIAKVPKRAATADEVRAEFASTLANLQVNYVDLLLLHWPCDVILQNTLSQVWKAMEDLVNDGKCKALGVCNFNKGALTKLLPSCTIRPVVNQVERHPLLPQWELVDYCGRNDIVIQAHTPLGQGNAELLSNAAVQNVAKAVGLTSAQIVIQWNLQQGVGVVPKCTQESHAKEIVRLLDSSTELSPEHMEMLDGLNKEARFVAPPFMYGTNVYCWGAHMPRK
jgi:DNA 3'-phosphatase